MKGVDYYRYGGIHTFLHIDNPKHSSQTVNLKPFLVQTLQCVNEPENKCFIFKQSELGEVLFTVSDMKYLHIDRLAVKSCENWHREPLLQTPLVKNLQRMEGSLSDSS